MDVGDANSLRCAACLDREAGHRHDRRLPHHCWRQAAILEALKVPAKPDQPSHGEIARGNGALQEQR